MPVVHDGGSPPPIVPYNSVVADPTAPAGTSQTTVVTKSGTVEEAVAAASQTVKSIPTAPALANLPRNARPGEMYSFPANPAAIYVYGHDNRWRALLLVEVV